MNKHEDECCNASGEHESDCCDAARDELESSRSELPSRDDKLTLAELWTDEPEPQERNRGDEPARRTKLDPSIFEASLALRRLNRSIGRLEFVAVER